MLIIGDRRFLNLEEAVRYLMNQREAGAGFNIAGLYAAQVDILNPIEGSIYGIGTSPDYTYYLYKDATFKLLGNFKGPTGQTGLTGNDGATGEKGNQGIKGIKGDDGAIGAGIGAIDNLDLSTGEADVSYVDGIARIHNSGDILYNGVENEEIITDFQIPIEGKDGIIIEADSTGKKIEVGIDPETLADKQDKLTAGDNITIAGNTISATQPDISTKQDKLTAGSNITINENNVISASGGGGGSSVYDKVIRTQAEFEALIADPTWFDAKSVAFVGQFELSTANNKGVKRPANVTRIDGYNNAKITVTNFEYSFVNAKGGLWDDGNTSNPRCYINDLAVDCSGTGEYEYDGIGFSGNNNTYTNCTGTGAANGFRGNNNTYTNCTGTCTGDCSSGFDGGNNNAYANCTGTGTGDRDGIGFGGGNNNAYANCTGTGNGASSGYGFYNCTNLTNCTGTGNGASSGYGFYNCSYANGCKSGSTPSSTSIWGGTNMKIDEDSCEMDV